MSKPLTKAVKIPVRIKEENADLLRLKYKALDRTMQEAQYLGNLAIRYSLAYKLKEIQRPVDAESKKQIAADTAIYRILNKERKFLNAATMATLARNFAAKTVRTNDKDAWAGRKSLPTYRSKFVPFRHTGTKLEEVEQEGQTQFVIQPSFGKKWLSDEILKELGSDLRLRDDQRGLELISYFSWKDKGAVEIVRRIVKGEYKLSDSQIKRGNKDLLVFLVYKFEPVQTQLDPDKVCGIDLGVAVPAVCAVNFGPQRKYIGDGGDVWAARSKFRAQRRRQQRRAGLYSKTKKWVRTKKEDAWIHTYYHAVTRFVINFCLQHGCGKIQAEDLTSLRQQQVKEEFQRLLWIPSKFHELLAYKAEEAGIVIVKINPRNTSRRCSECGHIAKENRKSQKEFACQNCGATMHADYNAAKNIALASGEVIERGYISNEQQNVSTGDTLL